MTEKLSEKGSDFLPGPVYLAHGAEKPVGQTPFRTAFEAQFEAADEADTEEFGRRLAACLFPGAVVGLIGPLGAGKTRLVRAIAQALGIADGRLVNSPTFILIQEYQARWPIYHFDTYRLRNEAEFLDLGVHEYFQGQGVCLVEWADRVENCLPRDRLLIHIAVTGPTSRQFRLEGYGEKYKALVKKMTR